MEANDIMIKNSQLGHLRPRQSRAGEDVTFRSEQLPFYKRIVLFFKKGSCSSEIVIDILRKICTFSRTRNGRKLLEKTKRAHN
ncbi:hypothetical protein GHT06_022311 [Daphnia sinensis]|uniref:Uncharacterized protein n=1 Tax=Daphnia sinensis TaxID=1820382 RepID=A0AAD5KH19_9CRUS|nr:hypothetical protein GHT06_022311 [Daphnia sinensis]